MRITWVASRASRGRQGWARIVTGLDRSQPGLRACLGDRWLNDGCEYDLLEGTVILEALEEGSCKNAYRDGRVLLVVGGRLCELARHRLKSHPSLLDVIERALAARPIAQEVSLTGPWQPIPFTLAYAVGSGLIRIMCREGEPFEVELTGTGGMVPSIAAILSFVGIATGRQVDPSAWTGGWIDPGTFRVQTGKE